MEAGRRRGRKKSPKQGPITLAKDIDEKAAGVGSTIKFRFLSLPSQIQIVDLYLLELTS